MRCTPGIDQHGPVTSLPAASTPSDLAALGGWPAVLGPLTNRRDLPREHARAAMAEILSGAATPAQLAGFAVALRMKGESIDELTGLVDAMLAVANLVPVAAPLRDRLVDIVGTGGDRSHSINVSTLSAFVIAAAGVPVCKHGNRAASSSCGSADVLEALGVAIELTPAGVAACLADAGLAFCFAPRFHPALRHAGPPRRELGIPTTFNILGPMVNPARVRRQVVGVSDPAAAEKMLGVLRANGASHVFVVFGHDGLDELTTTTTSTVFEWDGTTEREYVVDPAELGLARATMGDLRGGDATVNAAISRRVLAGERGAHRDVVVLNSAAGLVVGGAAPDLATGVSMAAATIDSGAAAAALDRLVSASQAAAAS